MIDVESPRLDGPVFEWAFWIFVAMAAASLMLGFWLGQVWLVLLSGTGLLVLLYGGFIEPQFVTVKAYRLPLIKEPKAWLRVAFLSDLHAGVYKGQGYYARVVRRTMQ